MISIEGFLAFPAVDEEDRSPIFQRLIVGIAKVPRKLPDFPDQPGAQGLMSKGAGVFPFAPVKQIMVKDIVFSSSLRLDASSRNADPYMEKAWRR